MDGKTREEILNSVYGDAEKLFGMDKIINNMDRMKARKAIDLTEKKTASEIFKALDLWFKFEGGDAVDYERLKKRFGVE